ALDRPAEWGVPGCDLRVGVAQVLVELDALCLEAVGRAAAAPCGRPLHADLDGNIEDDGEGRLEVADRDPLHRVENIRRDLSQSTLIGGGRVEESIAQHPEALIEGRLNQRPDMVVAGGGKQQ